MARLALVSRNPVMSMALTATEHDLVEVRAFELDEWLEERSEANVDALVLDLGSPQTSLRTVGDLRASGRWVPVLLVTTQDAGWSSAELLALPGVEFLSLPLSADKLHAAIRKALELPRTPPAPRDAPLLEKVPEVPLTPEPDFLAAAPFAAQSEPEQASPVVLQPLQDVNSAPTLPRSSQGDPVTSEQLESATSGVEEPTEATNPSEGSTTTLQAETSVLEPSPPQARPKKPRPAKPRPRATSADSALPEVKPRKRRRKEVSELRLDPRTPLETEPVEVPRQLAKEKAAPSPPPSDIEPAPTPATGQDPVEQMLRDADGYFTLEEAAQVIVEDACSRVEAEAAALLVPDGTLWRVTGGIGLRPLEHRLQLTTQSWLIANIAGAGKGIIVEGSDVARNDLRGAPLASHAHLVAAPVPQVHAVLLVARERDEPFTEEILSTLAALAEESRPHLELGLKLRSLARALARHIDPWDAPAT